MLQATDAVDMCLLYLKLARRRKVSKKHTIYEHKLACSIREYSSGNLRKNGSYCVHTALNTSFAGNSWQFGVKRAFLTPALSALSC